MAVEMAARYRRWFEYERDAFAMVIGALKTVPEEKRAEGEFRKAVAVLMHIITARKIWLGRLGATPPVPGSMFAENPDPDLDRLEADWRSVSNQWVEYLAALDDAAIDRVLEYQSLDAGRFRSRVEDILTQLFGHSWYHRGQVAPLIRAAGGQPVNTDFVLWSRETMS